MPRAVVTGAGVALTALLAAGCAGSSSSPGVSGSLGGVSASAGTTTDLSGPCQDVEQTLRSIPSRLEQAATTSHPTRTVPREIRRIEAQLDDEVDSADGDLRAAIQSYVDKLQQAGQAIGNGQRPDLSALDHTAIDDICLNGSGAAVTVSPSPTS